MEYGMFDPLIRTPPPATPSGTPILMHPGPPQLGHNTAGTLEAVHGSTTHVALSQSEFSDTVPSEEFHPSRWEDYPSREPAAFTKTLRPITQLVFMEQVVSSMNTTLASDFIPRTEFDMSNASLKELEKTFST